MCTYYILYTFFPSTLWVVCVFLGVSGEGVLCVKRGTTEFRCQLVELDVECGW